MSKFRFMVALPVAIAIWVAIKIVGIIDDSSLDEDYERGSSSCSGLLVALLIVVPIWAALALFILWVGSAS